jgi:hypothetical protein
MVEGRRVVKQGFFHVPIALLCAYGEFEVFTRYRVPVLFVQKVNRDS